MIPCKHQEFVHIRFYSRDSAMHRWNGISMSVEAAAFSPDSAEFLAGQPCGTIAVPPLQIASKDKNFIMCQFRYSSGRYAHCVHY